MLTVLRLTTLLTALCPIVYAQEKCSDLQDNIHYSRNIVLEPAPDPVQVVFKIRRFSIAITGQMLEEFFRWRSDALQRSDLPVSGLNRLKAEIEEHRDGDELLTLSEVGATLNRLENEKIAPADELYMDEVRVLLFHSLRTGKARVSRNDPRLPVPVLVEERYTANYAGGDVDGVRFLTDTGEVVSNYCFLYPLSE
jgi:hypothetical protein